MAHAPRLVSPTPLVSWPRPVAAALAVLVAVALALVPGSRAAAQADTLPLGDPDLVETRTSRDLADGDTLTRIVRGTEPAPADQIDTTTRGPGWCTC